MSNVENMFFKKNMIDNIKDYPMVSDEELDEMNNDYHSYKSDVLKVYFYNRKNINDDLYVDIYFVGPYGIRRFVLRNDYSLETEVQNELDDIVKSKKITVDIDNYIQFQEEFEDLYPTLNIQKYNAEKVKLLINRLYYKFSYPNGPRSVLYDSGLEKSAFFLDEIEEYNIVGKSPKEILNMPFSLIRYMEKIGNTQWFDADIRKIYCDTFHYFSVFMGDGKCNSNPSYYQWLYLVECYRCKLESKNIFDKRIYKKLAYCNNQETFENYIIFVLNKYIVEDESGDFKKIPDRIWLEGFSNFLIRVQNSGADIESWNRDIKTNNALASFTYRDDIYSVYAPASVKEFLIESYHTTSVLFRYIEIVKKGYTNMVYVRKHGFDKVYMIVEIFKGRIDKVWLADFTNPTLMDLVFLEKYAAGLELSYDPEMLLDYEDQDDVDADIWDYIIQFNQSPYCNSQVDADQLDLYKAFPECFVRIDDEEYNEAIFEMFENGES